MNILYVNSCIREESRTDRIARALLNKLGDYEEVQLAKEDIQPLTLEGLEKRTKLISENDYTAEEFRFAKQFAEADIIVVSAPFWDLSFPAALKAYFENIYITGIVSEYGPDGRPHGLCNARKLYYVTTAGGPYTPDYSYNYVRDLAMNYFGIKDAKLILAEMLDVEGFDAEKIVEATISNLEV
ncbi:MAG: NAD(P)H-dependent oxidoreductase [Veillonella sp.]|nr:NAD(P)H-dependent oxidoreductase [Veillonella sp.]